MGKYIYGIIEGSEEGSFGPIGINGAEVYTTNVLDIASITSNSTFFDYRSMPKPDVAIHLSIYQSVIERVMKDYTVIPVKFGMIAKDESEVRQILLKGYSELRETLDEMQNKIEFDVVALWSDFDSMLKEIGEQKEIKVLKAKINAEPAQVTLNDRIKIGRKVKVLLDKRRDETLKIIQNTLNEIAVDTYAHECLDDKMLMNTAFLIEKDKEAQFDKLINEIDNRLQGKVNFRCVGPLPPYSFSQVEVKRIQEDDLKKGMAILGLEKEASLSEIKHAYKIQARRDHPDVNPKDLEASERFKELTDAYELLLGYSQGAEKGKVSKNSITIKL